MAAPAATLWSNILLHPTTELDVLEREVTEGRVRHPTTTYSKTWTCECGAVNKASVYRLVTLPAYSCKCGAKNPSEYDWKLLETQINMYSLNFRIYDQGHTDRCSLFASLAVVDCARRVGPSVHATQSNMPLDEEEFSKIYQLYCGMECGKESRARLYEGYDNIPIILTVCRDVGIPFNTKTLFDLQHPVQPQPCLRIRGFFQVPNGNVEYMRRLIANGFPLVTSVNVGRIFELVGKNQVYYAPIAGQCRGAHAVALIGVGMADRNGVPDMYFVARNSHGLRRHPDQQLNNYGADFCVWASDVRNTWGIYI